jgi:nucleoside-triphosphatase THEP1
VTLADTEIRRPYRVGKYGIDIDCFEQVGIPALHKAFQQSDLAIIDEIGRMELFSADFREPVSQMIDSGQRILGTIMLNPHPWADVIKRQPQVHLITVTRDNYQPVLEGLPHWLRTTLSLKL